MFSIQAPSSVTASAEFLAHDGSVTHHLEIYLCVDPDGWIDGTAIVKRSTQYLNVTLPAPPEDRTSLGWLQAAEQIDFAKSGFPQSRYAAPLLPGCLDNPTAESVASNVRYAQIYGGAYDVLFNRTADKRYLGLPDQVVKGEIAGFPYLVSPDSSPEPAPMSFRWFGIQNRSWSDRFFRLDFLTNIVAALGMVELPTDVWVYLPADTTPINIPTSAVYSAGHNGTRVLDIHVQAYDEAVEVDWIDDPAASGRDFSLLALGIGLGAAGGIAGSFIFAWPRWDDWILRRLA